MIRDNSWMDSAICAQIGPDPFQPAKGANLAPARAVCNACPVRTPCLDYALALNDFNDVGIWGGLSVEERQEKRETA